MNTTSNKLSFYNGDGTGRDGYIFGNNGGFIPQKRNCEIEQLGTFVISK